MPVIHYNYENAFAPENQKARKARIAQIEANAPRVADSEKYLEDLRKDGWNLTDVDLDLVEAHVERIREAYGSIDFGTTLSNLLHETHEAIKRERATRKLAQQRQANEQHWRITSIRKAAHELAEAHALMEGAEGANADPSMIKTAAVRIVTAAEVREMDAASLKRLISSESLAESRNESDALTLKTDAESLEKWGAARGRRLAKELRAIATDRLDAAAANRANAAQAAAELDRRAKAEAATESAKESIVQTTADVNSLLQRVAELEAQMAAR